MTEITTTKEIQEISLKILLFVDKICKENNIKYSLAYGTALGAIRHKGFIPWDDDVDIIMTRDNYEKFLEIMDNFNSEEYKCLHYGKNFPNYFYGFAKVVDLNTYLDENSFIRNPDLGVYIDIFPVDGIDEKTFEKDLNKFYKYQKLLLFSAVKKFRKSKKGLAYTLKKLIIYPYVKLLGWKHWLKKSEQIRTKISLKNSNYGNMFGFVGEKAKFQKEIYDDLIEVDFEGYKLPILKDYDTYLTQLYGNYMTPPPKEKQVSNHAFKAFRK